MACIFAWLEADAQPASVLGYLLRDLRITDSRRRRKRSPSQEQTICMLTAKHKSFSPPPLELGMFSVLDLEFGKTDAQVRVEVITPNFSSPCDTGDQIQGLCILAYLASATTELQL